MTVAELMSTHVAAVQDTDSLSVAAQLMWVRDCGALPVLDPDGRVVGMITDRDVCMACWMQDRPPTALRVGETRSRRLFFCAPNDSIAAAERMLRAHRIRRLPVLDDQHRLLGVLSLADIVRGAQRSDDAAATLATICERRPRVEPDNAPA